MSPKDIIEDLVLIEKEILRFTIQFKHNEDKFISLKESYESIEKVSVCCLNCERKKLLEQLIEKATIDCLKM